MFACRRVCFLQVQVLGQRATVVTMPQRDPKQREKSKMYRCLLARAFRMSQVASSCLTETTKPIVENNIQNSNVKICSRGDYVFSAGASLVCICSCANAHAQPMQHHVQLHRALWLEVLTRPAIFKITFLQTANIEIMRIAMDYMITFVCKTQCKLSSRSICTCQQKAAGGLPALGTKNSVALWPTKVADVQDLQLCVLNGQSSMTCANIGTWKD